MSVKGGIILLSSSPPRLFAPSPTPVDKPSSSPPLPSPDAIFASQRSEFAQTELPSWQIQASWLEEQRRYKTASTITQYSASDARLAGTPVLKEKLIRKNVPVSNQLLGSEIVEKAPGKQKDPTSISPGGRQCLGEDKDIHNSSTEHNASTVLKNDPRAQSRVNEKRQTQELSPLLLDKAPARKLDWTPPATRTREECPDPAAIPFCDSLRGSFGYNAVSDGPDIFESVRRDDKGTATKRRKLDIVDSSNPVLVTAVAAPRLAPKSGKSTKEPTVTRGRSPKKKYTTITGLATASYSGAEPIEASPMMQYLSATQQRTLDDHSGSIAGTAKRKLKVKRSKPMKKAPHRSTLLSPQSAIKTLEDQDTLFGSASQLARDESPSFTRDTVQPTQHSEKALLMSDPVSTQISIPTTDIPQTPNRLDRRGLSRFAKSKNLWSAAGRDDDNALLQVDTVDMFDSPDLRAAFAGKDVLLEPGAPRPRDSSSPEKLFVGQEKPRGRSSGIETQPSPALRDGELSLSCEMEPLLGTHRVGFSSAARTSNVSSQARALHSTAAGKADTHQARTDWREKQTEPPRRHSNLLLTKPSYQGFTTGQLTSQLAAYGFKPVKKREKMIEVLDRCWDEKNKPGTRAGTEGTMALDKATEMSHSDFLTNVHDVSSRPIPKVTKPRGRPKKDGTSSPQSSKAKKALPQKSPGQKVRETDAADGKKKQAKGSAKTRVRKANNLDTALSGPPSRKKSLKDKIKSEKTALSREHALDVDEIEDNDEDLNHDAMEYQGDDNTGVKPADPGRACSLPPGPPSSDAFEPAARLSETAIPTTSKVDEPKAARSTAFFSVKTANPTVANDTVSSESPPPSSAISAVATTTTTAPSSLSPSQPHQLFGQITVAITTFRRPQASSIYNSQQTPTFHEKILMYDPIVLEDLAAWLNTEGFKAIGEDREVGAIELREWCEERGICCLWRGGWRKNHEKSES